MNYELGCKRPPRDGADLTRSKVFNDPGLSKFVSPFPPLDLGQNTAGLSSKSDFASHGTDLWMALFDASPKQLVSNKHLQFIL